MALQSPEHHNPDTGESRLAADLGIPDPVLDQRLAASLTPRTAPRHRGDYRPGADAWQFVTGSVSRSLDYVLGVMAPPAQRQDGGDR